LLPSRPILQYAFNYQIKFEKLEQYKSGKSKTPDKIRLVPSTGKNPETGPER
jgi:hypothetical protein